VPDPRCDGCLGTGQCWICAGDGCPRCSSSGACHLCSADPGRVIRLVEPPQPAPVDAPREP
jgi:hypothetical protein